VKLTEIATCLLESESPAESLRAVAELHAMFSRIVRLDDDPASEDQIETLLNEGKAISPVDAARCILDYMRTRSFLRGVQAAIVEAQRRFPGQTIHILYAGCGPYAPLVIPLTTRFSADQIQFTLIDIHRRSIDAVRRVVEALDLSAYVQDFVQCDATSYRQASDLEPHILLTETMQKALEKEPQVAVTRNLIPFLRKGVILVPERISLNACLANVNKEMAFTASDESPMTQPEGYRKRIDLGVVFELTAESVHQPWNKCPDSSSGAALCSDPVTVRVPEVTIDRAHLMIMTTINVFDSIVLREYDSGLTYPTVLFDLGHVRTNDQFEFQYMIGATPGLRYRQVVEER
jgi:hypothetical protein